MAKRDPEAERRLAEATARQKELDQKAEVIVSAYQDLPTTSKFWSKTKARVILGSLLYSIAERAGVAWGEVDEALVEKFYDALEEEASKSVESQLVGNGLIEEY